MASTAVDYSKTGIPVDMSLLRAIKTNKYRPDFMAPSADMVISSSTSITFDDPHALDDDDDRPQHQYYASSNVLGALYRAIDVQRIWASDIRVPTLPPSAGSSSIWVSVLHLAISRASAVVMLDWARHVPEAQSIRHTYNDSVATTCFEYSDHPSIPVTELEVFSGNIFNKSGVQTRRQRDRSIQIKDEFDRICDMVTKLIRKRVLYDSDEEDEESLASGSLLGEGEYDHVEALELSVACLAVAVELAGGGGGGWVGWAGRGEKGG